MVDLDANEVPCGKHLTPNLTHPRLLSTIKQYFLLITVCKFPVAESFFMGSASRVNPSRVIFPK